MHLLFYRMRPDVQAVCHARPPTATGFAAAGRALDEAALHRSGRECGDNSFGVLWRHTERLVVGSSERHCSRLSPNMTRFCFRIASW